MPFAIWQAGLRSPLNIPEHNLKVYPPTRTHVAKVNTKRHSLELKAAETRVADSAEIQPIASRLDSPRKPKSCSLLNLAKDHLKFSHPILSSISEFKSGFSRTRDSIFATYETMSGWLSRRSKPVRNIVSRVLGGFFGCQTYARETPCAQRWWD
jgi:hypothetical protein